MGGIFLTTDNNSIEKAISVYSEIGLNEYSKFDLGRYSLLYFPKLTDGRSTIKNSFFRHNNDLIIGVGFFIFKNKLGNDALRLIYESLKTLPSELVFSNIKGHFSFVTCINGEINVISDKSGMYKLYKANERENLYIYQLCFWQ